MDLPEDVVAHRPPGYAIDVDLERVDAHRFTASRWCTPVARWPPATWSVESDRSLRGRNSARSSPATEGL
jgi:hypothetical protein